MEESFAQIKATIQALEEMHTEQIASFDQELLPDLEAQSRKRSRAIDKLGKIVDTFAGNIHSRAGSEEGLADEQDQVRLCKEGIARILEQNRLLEQKVQNQKTMLQQSMKRVSAGRKAIGFYGSSASEKNRAQVMNLRG